MSEEVPVRGQGVCVQCIRPKCCTAMHVTCAQYHGLPRETLQSGTSGFRCPKHLVCIVSNVRGQIYHVTPFQHSGSLTRIEEGEDVYVWKDKKYEVTTQ